MNIDISFLQDKLVGTKIPRPLSGTLSGHAAGEPFDKHAHAILKSQYPEITYRQFEYLNLLYLSHPEVTTAEGRFKLIGSIPLAYLLNRGVEATRLWTPDNQFVEKQNDTADILIIKDSFANIIDIKTFNIDKMGQAPNIVSSLKIARMCKLMFDTNDFNSHDIIYVGIHWKLINEQLVCTKAIVRELFKAKPSNLYINWSAALQIQFHVEQLDQEFEGSMEEWCRSYLARFVTQAQIRLQRSKKEFIDPFIKYIN